MRRIFASLALVCAALAAPSHARTVTITEEWVYDESESESSSADRLVSGVPLEVVPGIATYGPFRVVDANRAALVGITDERSPRDFAAMLNDYPELAVLELVECPGTFDDIANLELGRMIRRNGIATHVPAHGSVRSGAVELFVAGAVRSIDQGARFAVHAWEDDSGMEANDYSLSAPENRKYLAYYREMGMSVERAGAFYAMTNSVPFEDALWLDADAMRDWVQTAPDGGDVMPANPLLAYLDLDLGRGVN